MIPTIVIVGRPNVGKSTLFNRLTRSRDALVADAPGLTRDRDIAAQLRKSERRIWLVVNKAECMQPAAVNAEFHELALGEPLAIAAAHGEGVSDLADLILADYPAAQQTDEARRRGHHPRIAVVGRPNVGKSTLVNRVLGEERVLVHDEPGTTRDSIYVDFERGGRAYTLIDTAGMRRRGRVTGAVEKFSIVKTLQAVEDANVVVLVVDAREQIFDQDAHIAGYILEAGRALVVAVNKWDGLSAAERAWTKRSLARTLNFIEFAPAHYISALAGTGIQPLIDSIERAYAAAMMQLPTPKLTRALITAVARQAPPRAGMFRPKLRYAHQGGSNPPRIVIHGTSLDHISDSYRHYLERFFRDIFKLQGTPLRIEFRQGANPYAKRRAKR